MITSALSVQELERIGEAEDEIARIEGGVDVPGSALSLGLAGKVDEAFSALVKCDSLRREVNSKLEAPLPCQHYCSSYFCF